MLLNRHHLACISFAFSIYSMVNILRGWAAKYGVQENPDDMKGAKGLVHEFFFPSYRPVMLPSERAFVEGTMRRMPSV